MQAGKLRHRIELQRNVPTRHGMGEQLDSWAKYATVWASVEPLTGTELLNAQQISAEVTHRVKIRFCSDVKPEHQVIHNGRTLEIIAVLNIAERRRSQHLMCKEVVIDG